MCNLEPWHLVLLVVLLIMLTGNRMRENYLDRQKDENYIDISWLFGFV